MRRRLAILGLTTVVLILTLVIVPFAVVESKFRVLRDVDEQAALAAQVALDAPELMGGNLRTALNELAKSRSTARASVLIFDASGTLQASSGTGETKLTDEELNEIRRITRGLSPTPTNADPPLLPHRPTIVSSAIARGQQTIGAAVIVADISEVRRDIISSWLRLGLRALAIIVISALLSLPITRWTVRPLVALHQAMDQVTGGSETARVEVRGPSEVRVLARSFNDLADQVQHSLQNQRSFVSDASHQLRTPLTALRLRLELLGLDIHDLTPTNQTLTVNHQRAMDEMDDTIHIVEQLLELADVARELKIDPQSPSHVIGQRLESWNLLSSQRGIIVVAEPLPPDRVMVQRGALGQLLDVLVDNAIKFGPDGGQVSITGNVTQELFELTVSNAVSNAELTTASNMLSPSFVANDGRHDRNATRGYGLGLQIAHRLVESVGGSLEISVTGNLSEANLRLVCQQDPART